MCTRANISKYLSLVFFVILFAWISFFPQPVQEKYRLFVFLFLFLFFFFLLIERRFNIFKLSDIPLFCFLLGIGINVIFARDTQVALKSYLDLALPVFLLYYLVCGTSFSGAGLKYLAITISLISIAVAMLGIFEALFAFNPLYEYFIENCFYPRYISRFVRPMSTQFNPVVLGSYLLASLPFNFFLFRQRRRSLKTLGAMGVVVCLVIAVLTFSRGVFLGLSAMAAFYLFLRRKRLLSVGLLIAALSSIVLLAAYLPYPFSRLSADSMIGRRCWGVLSSYRLNRCIMASEMLEDYPLAGAGLKHFRIKFYEYYPAEGPVPYESRIADNMYLSLLAESGLIGFSAFLFFIFSIFKKSYITLKRSGPVERSGLALIISGLVGLLVNAAGYELFYWPGPYMYLCVYIGLIEAFYRGSFKKNHEYRD